MVPHGAIFEAIDLHRSRASAGADSRDLAFGPCFRRREPC